MKIYFLPLTLCHHVDTNSNVFALASFSDFCSVQIMAFMAMRKNLDERQRKKNFDEIFKKFDHNHNQRVAIREFTEVGPNTSNA